MRPVIRDSSITTYFSLVREGSMLSIRSPSTHTRLQSFISVFIFVLMFDQDICFTKIMSYIIPLNLCQFYQSYN